jgi:hypothetical protein
MSLDIQVQSKLLIKKCHVCGHLNESTIELQRCGKCQKSFLPSAYFSKVHDNAGTKYKQLYSAVDEIDEKDLIVGIHVIW